MYNSVESRWNNLDRLIPTLYQFGDIQRMFRDNFGVKRMVVGSSSVRRVFGLKEVSLFPVEQWDMSGYVEPIDTNVLTVAQHKCNHVVSMIHGTYGSPSLIITEDTLTGQAGEVLHQMRRNGSYTWNEIQAEIDRMVEILQKPSWWVWHVGAIMSVRGLRVGWGREYSIAYGEIPEKKIRDSFATELDLCQTRPPRLDLLGKFQSYAQKVYARVTTRELLECGPNMDDHMWWACYEGQGPNMSVIDIDSVLKCVRFGIPSDDGLNGYVRCSSQ